MVGLRVDKSQLIKEVRVRVGDHDYPEDYEFHPKTGGILWKEEQTWIFPDYCEGDPEDVHYGESCKVAGYRVITSPLFYALDSRLYIALEHVTASSYDYEATDRCDAPRDIFSAMKNADEFRRKMLELGLWDEKAFGLWSIL
jgi:hypothetical protein